MQTTVRIRVKKDDPAVRSFQTVCLKFAAEWSYLCSKLLELTGAFDKRKAKLNLPITLIFMMILFRFCFHASVSRKCLFEVSHVIFSGSSVSFLKHRINSTHKSIS